MMRSFFEACSLLQIAFDGAQRRNPCLVEAEFVAQYGIGILTENRRARRMPWTGAPPNRTGCGTSWMSPSFSVDAGLKQIPRFDMSACQQVVERPNRRGWNIGIAQPLERFCLATAQPAQSVMMARNSLSCALRSRLVLKRGSS